MKKPRLLDLFCGSGGAGMGYHRAGFEVIGVDIKPKPYYPFKFHQADALEYPLSGFDVVHASPPCQVYSRLSHLSGKQHKALIPIIRERLKKLNIPYVIENVIGAPLVNPIMLCGSMFGLKTKCGAQLLRHRLFEVYPILILTPKCNHAKTRTIGIFGNKARDTAAEKRHYTKSKETRGPAPNDILFTLKDAQYAMGCPWMPFTSLSQAIPPAYTEFIGKQLMAHLKTNANF
jgi:DNA (cytosine-5)-methyltransferase 1